MLLSVRIANNDGYRAESPPSAANARHDTGNNPGAPTNQPDIGVDSQGKRIHRNMDGDTAELDLRKLFRKHGENGIPSSESRTFSNRLLDHWNNLIFYYNADGDRAEIGTEFLKHSQKKLGGESDPLEKTSETGECKSCASRKYMDGSDDSSVSFQSPTGVNPRTAAIRVAAHESEHVFKERAKVQREGGKILLQTVTIKHAICPECGQFYPSGGVTRTVASRPKNNGQDNTSSDQNNHNSSTS